jgi:hypothetical protein
LAFCHRAMIMGFDHGPNTSAPSSLRLLTRVPSMLRAHLKHVNFELSRPVSLASHFLGELTHYTNKMLESILLSTGLYNTECVHSDMAVESEGRRRRAGPHSSTSASLPHLFSLGLSHRESESSRRRVMYASALPRRAARRRSTILATYDNAIPGRLFTPALYYPTSPDPSHDHHHAFRGQAILSAYL